MKTFLLVFVTLIYFVASAQNPNIDYKSAIKIYNTTSFRRNISLNQDTTDFSEKTSTTNLKIFHPTIAFQWKTKKNNFHEIELTNFSFDRETLITEQILDSTGEVTMPIWGFKRTSSFISARYEFTLNFNKFKDKKIVPSIGFALEPYFLQAHHTPAISNVYPYGSSALGVGGYLIPRITYYLSSRLFFEFSIPIYLFDSSIQRSRWLNPTLPKSQQTVYTSDFELFPGIFNLRFGIGIKL